MNKKYKLALPIGILAVLVAALVWYFHGHTVAILSPQGQVGQKERNLIIYAALLSLIVIVPVYIMTFTIAWRYRESNKKNVKYSPEFDHHRGIEFVWWAVPCAIITLLAVAAWNSSHELDPYRALVSDKKPITIQVVALDWKWLFIYPDQNIASVNFLQFPVNTPVNFEITSDAPMNSFWIPRLGGQIYAMPGMNTELHLEASQMGDFNGSSANISGKGFAGMKFIARASSTADFDNWLTKARLSQGKLNLDSYNKLAKPSQNNLPAYYSSEDHGLYDLVMMKYMMPLQGLNVQ